MYRLQRRLRGHDIGMVLNKLEVKRTTPHLRSRYANIIWKRALEPNFNYKTKTFQTCEEELHQKLYTLSFVNVTEIMDHVTAESTKEHKGSTHVHSFMLFHGGLRH